MWEEDTGPGWALNTRVKAINGIMRKASRSLGLSFFLCSIFPSSIGFLSAQWEIRIGCACLTALDG